MPRGVTPIDLPDFDSIPNEIQNSNYPPPKNANPNFHDQIDSENTNRVPHQLSRRENDWRKSINGGSAYGAYSGETIYQNEFEVMPSSGMSAKNARPDRMQMDQSYDNDGGGYGSSISCINIANHVSNCPICTRFYAPEDKTHLYFIIMVLSLICFVLFKRVVDLK